MVILCEKEAEVVSGYAVFFLEVDEIINGIILRRGKLLGSTVLGVPVRLVIGLTGAGTATAIAVGWFYRVSCLLLA